MADNADRIAEIRAILRGGATTVKTEGVEVSYDFDQLRAELRELMADDDDQRGRRPVASRFNLGGF
jgi:hypothetical protein